MLICLADLLFSLEWPCLINLAAISAQVHYVASKNPFVMIGKAIEGIAAHTRESASGGSRAPRSSGGGSGGGKPSGISGVPVSSVVCLQDGVLTCGLDGAVRYHTLAADVLTS